MPGWLGGALLLATIFGVAWAWESFRTSPTRAGRAAAKTADAAYLVWVKLAGVALLALGCFGMWSLFSGGFELWKLGGLLLIVWGGHLTFFYR